MGFGTGVRSYFEGGSSLIPFYADIRGNFVNKNISPYMALGLGYSFEASDDFDGVGVLINPTLGANFKISQKCAINTGIGYELQGFDSFGDIIGSISINAGISF